VEDCQPLRSALEILEIFASCAPASRISIGISIPNRCSLHSRYQIFLESLCRRPGPVTAHPRRLCYWSRSIRFVKSF